MIEPQTKERERETLGRLRRVVQLAPDDPELRLALARALLERASREEAIDEIRSVIALWPNHLEARKLLAAASRPL